MKFLPVLFISILFFLGCNKSEQLVIVGQLVTEQGKNVSDAHIHFIPNLVSHSKKMPSTSIGFMNTDLKFQGAV